jgi:hypothetical protein
MKLLGGPQSIAATFERLWSKHDKLSFAVAWASVGFPEYEAIKANSSKIKRGIVGTHFHQTHPEFIASFRKHKHLRFILEADELFHPKVFLFESGDGRWDCIIGSANFTAGGFMQNHEVCIAFGQDDVSAAETRKQCDELLNSYWQLGRTISESELDIYRETWARYKRYLNRASGRFGSGRVHKVVEEVELLQLSWDEFASKVRKDDAHSTDQSTRLLKEAAKLFNSHNSFAEMSDVERAGIAGYFETEGLPWKWFGSMQGAGRFKGKVNQNNLALARAIDEVPLAGRVSRDDYLKYIETFKRAFSEGDRMIGHGLSTATRLLAMKRPDYFVCFDKANAKGLCEAFGISRFGHQAYESYWDEIIERILDSAWWDSSRPTDDIEASIWDGRAAFLDAIYYDPEFWKR